MKEPSRAALLSLFTAPVSFALREPGDHLAELAEEEQQLTTTMGVKRLHGFSAGRLAARDALAELGIHNSPILIGEKRKPVWPTDIRGSISHCKDQCIAVVTDNQRIGGIGIDVEQLKPLSDGVEKLIMTDPERAHIRTLEGAGQGSVQWGCVIFSLKESLYKCLNPVTGKWIDFHQARLTLLPGEGDQPGQCQIQLDPGVHNDLTQAAALTARFLCTDSHVYSAVSLVWPEASVDGTRHSF